MGIAPGRGVATPPPYPGSVGEGYRRRRAGLRWVFLGFGVILLGVGVLFLLFALTPATFGLHNPYGFPFGGGLIGIFLVLWGSMVTLRAAVGLAGRRRWAGGPPPGRHFEPAIVAARQRYARGEISREQFLQIEQDLRRPPGPLP